MINNSKDLIKAGYIIADGYDYITKDGRQIKRKYIGRRRSTLAWQVGTVIYRNLFDAYYDVNRYAEV